MDLGGASGVVWSLGGRRRVFREQKKEDARWVEGEEEAIWVEGEE